jgi:Domain of unknown function (DUF6457)
VTLQDWMDALADALSVEEDVDMTAVLDLARDAAHNVARPAAPLTTFIVGYAAGQRGGSEEQIAECIEIATSLAANWDRSA